MELAADNVICSAHEETVTEDFETASRNIDNQNAATFPASEQELEKSDSVSNISAASSSLAVTVESSALSRMMKENGADDETFEESASLPTSASTVADYSESVVAKGKMPECSQTESRQACLLYTSPSPRDS